MSSYNRRLARKAIAAIFTMSMVGLLGTGTASATHTHSMQTGNGSCVLLAQNGGEKSVVLPFVTEGQAHPLHVLVHKGEPGSGDHIKIGVKGTSSDPCLGNYVNDHHS